MSSNGGVAMRDGDGLQREAEALHSLQQPKGRPDERKRSSSGRRCPLHSASQPHAATLVITLPQPVEASAASPIDSRATVQCQRVSERTCVVRV